MSIDIGGGDGEVGGRRDWTSEDVVNTDKFSDAGSEVARNEQIDPLVDVDDFTDDEDEDVLLQKNEVLEQLQSATSTCDLRTLKKLLKMADKMNLDNNVVSDGAVYLERCNVMKKELIACVNGNKGESVVAAAVSKAQNIPNFKNEVLEGAKLALAQLRGAGNIDQDIDEAIGKCDLDRLKTLLDLADSIQFDGEMAVFGSEFYTRVTKIVQALEDAVKHARGGELEEAIEDAKQITGFPQDSIEKAEAELGRLMNDEGGNHAALLEALEVGLTNVNVNAMRPLVKKAVDYGIRGNASLSKAQKVIRVYDLLTTALQDRSAKQLNEGLVLAKGLGDIKLPVISQAEKQQGRIEMEEPVIEMLRQALVVKKLTTLNEAIDAAEELDKELLRIVEMELAVERTKDLGGEAPLSPEKTKIEVVEDTSKLTGVDARRAKALAKHVNRQEANRKDDVGARIKFEKFNPPELDACKEMRLVITRVENDLSSGIKRCAHERHLPDTLKECREIGLKSKAVIKASSLLFRAVKAKKDMFEALSLARNSGNSDYSQLFAAVTYAKTRVHDRFVDPLVDECVLEIKRMEEMKRHEAWIRTLIAATHAAPLYHSTGNSGKKLPNLLKRRSSRGSFTERSESFNEEPAGRRRSSTMTTPAPKLTPKRKSSFREGDASDTNTSKRGGSFSDSKRLSFSESFAESRRNSMSVVDPSLLALSLDSLLRSAVDEATEEDRPVYGQFLTTEHPLVEEAEKVLKKRVLLREGLTALLRIHEHDSADPKSAAKFIETARTSLAQLLLLDNLSDHDEPIILARIAEATIKDDAEAVKNLIGQLTSKSPPTIPAAQAPPPAPPPPNKLTEEDTEPDIYIKTTGCSLMHYAALHGAVNTGRLLVAKYGAELMTLQDDRGWTPLHIACMRGRCGFVEMAISSIAGASVQSDSFQAVTKVIIAAADKTGRTPLHLACYYGRPLTATWLIEHGASAEVLDGNGRTAVSSAKEMGHAGLAADLVKLLHNK